MAAEPGAADRAYAIASLTTPTRPHRHVQPHPHPSATQAICSGQASDQGNTIYAIPYALRPVHGPPYPELSIVLIPNILREARTAPHRTAPHHCATRAMPRRAAPHAPHRTTTSPRRAEYP